MNITFTPEAWDDYLYWQKYDKRIVKRVNELLKDISKQAFTGLGKPDPLKYRLQGFWSRRINQEHRLVYRITDGVIEVVSVRYHYHDNH